ncbi:MAG: tetratricopeptide repeat protein [Terriglobia bacterium]
MQAWHGSILVILATTLVSSAEVGPLSPAEERIQAAEKAIQNNPQRYQTYNDLAFALVSRARETSDAKYYRQAAEAVEKSLRLASDNFEALKAQVEVFLGQRRWEEARESARPLNRSIPDDVPVWGYLAEAAFELGDYDEAVKTTQWMLDLRRNNTRGLLRAAELRVVYGYLDGALDFYNQACQQVPPQEVEQIAFIFTRMAGVELMRGRLESAQKLLDLALQQFPGYYLSLEMSARLRAAQGKNAEAVDLWRRRNQQMPTPDSRYELAQALEQDGQRDQAKTAYAEFERVATPLVNQPANANRELVLYNVNYAHNPAEALRVARLEVARRHDVFTLDAYAWALAANGQDAEAKAQMEKPMAIGTKDAAFFYHAGVIASKLNDRTAAERYFKQSLDLNSVSTVSAEVRRELESIESRARSGQAPARGK